VFDYVIIFMFDGVFVFCLQIRDSQVPDSEAVSEGNGKVCICMNVCIYVSMEIYSPLPLPLP